MDTAHATTVVVVTWRGAGHIAACLDALAHQGRPHRTLVVDNASDDGTAEILAGHPSEPRALRLERNTGYAGGLAAALSEVNTRYIAWLNDDAEPAPDWLERLERALDADPRAGAASARLEDASGEVQSYALGLTPIGYGEDIREHASGEVFGFCGGAALIRTDALRTVGGIPAEFFCYYEDTDTSWRLQLDDWRVLAVPEARVRHAHGASTAIGSAQFHRWNERNRLLTLIRCAPAPVALRELARFKLLTLILPFRRLEERPPNLHAGLRLRVLMDVTRGLPRALRVRRDAPTAVSRREVWRRWAA